MKRLVTRFGLEKHEYALETRGVVVTVSRNGQPQSVTHPFEKLPWSPSFARGGTARWLGLAIGFLYIAILGGIAAALERGPVLSTMAFWAAIGCIFLLCWLPSRYQCASFWYEGRHLTLLVRPSKTDDLNEFLNVIAQAKYAFLLGKLRAWQEEGVSQVTIAASILEWFDMGVINKEGAVLMWNQLKQLYPPDLGPEL